MTGHGQGLIAILPGACDLDHRQLALDGIAAQGQIGDLVDRHKPLQLMADLLDRLGRARGDDGDARKMFRMRHLGNREALDIIASSGKKPDDAGKHTRLVIDQNRERMDLDIGLADG